MIDDLPSRTNTDALYQAAVRAIRACEYATASTYLVALGQVLDAEGQSARAADIRALASRVASASRVVDATRDGGGR